MGVWLLKILSAALPFGILYPENYFLNRGRPVIRSCEPISGILSWLQFGHSLRQSKLAFTSLTSASRRFLALGRLLWE